MTLTDRLNLLTDFDPEKEYLGEDIMPSHLHEFAIGKLLTMNLKMEEKNATDEEFENLTKAFAVIKKAANIPMKWKEALTDFKIDELTFKYIMPSITE